MFYDSIIIDGSNLAYKSFSIHKNFTADINNKLIYTGVTFGFINSLIKLKKENLKDNGRFFVAWDRGHKYRSKIYPQYKQKRKEQKNNDDDYIKYKSQIPILEKVLPILGVTQVYKEGCEADDIVGTLSKIRSEKFNEDVLIFSGDHDFYQLINDKIHLLNHRGAKNITYYDTESFKKTFGITPDKYYDVMCLTGCSGDEVPGINGIGEKTAIKIIQNNPDLIQNIIKGEIKDNEFVGSKNQLEKIKNNINTVILASKLVKIYTDLKGMKYNKGRKDLNKLEEVFELLEFNSLLRASNWKIISEL